jgi:hypothetical protein
VYVGFAEMGKMARVTRENRLGFEGGVGYIDSKSGRTWFGGGGIFDWSFDLSFFEGVSGLGEAVGLVGVLGMEEIDMAGVCVGLGALRGVDVGV